MLVNFNSRYRPNQNESSCNYNQRLLMPRKDNCNITKVKVINCTIPNSIPNIDDYIFTWSEPSGSGSTQVEKSITIPQGMYTLDTFCSTYSVLAQAASGLINPVFTVAGSPIDSKLIFSLPTSNGVPVSAWQIKWLKCTPNLSALCGFSPNVTNTALSGTDFISTYTYNFSTPSVLYCYLSLFPSCLIPGSTIQATFPIINAVNSGLVASSQNDGLCFNIDGGTVLTNNQMFQIRLLKDDGDFANLRGQDWSLSLLLS